MEMTDNELRLAVAEAVGWTEIKRHSGSHVGLHPETKICGFIPDFASDLNAMHKAVAGLNEPQRHAYAVLLANEFFPLGWRDWRDSFALSEATARQRALAFVQVFKGK